MPLLSTISTVNTKYIYTAQYNKVDYLVKNDIFH